SETQATSGIQLGSAPTDCLAHFTGSLYMAHGARPIQRDAVFPDELTDEPISDGLIYTTSNQHAVKFGFLDGGRWWSGARIGFVPPVKSEDAEDAELAINVWSVYQSCDGEQCRGDDIVASERLYVNVTTPVSEAHQQFVDTAWGAQAPPEPISPAVSYHLSVEEGDAPSGERIKRFLDRLNARRQDMPVGPGGLAEVRLADGWRGASPDESQRHFPSGVRSSIDAIHERGMAVSARVDTFMAGVVPDEYGDALVRQKNRRPATFSADGFIDAAVMDPTHPKTRDWLRERLREAFVDWNLDVAYASLMPFRTLVADDVARYRWHMPNLTRMQVLTSAYELLMEVKAEVAPNATLGLTNTPPGAAFAGSYRSNVGLDHFYNAQSPIWDGKWGLKEMLAAFAGSWHTHSAQQQMEFGPLTFVQGRTRNEAELLLTLGLLSGAQLCFADDVSGLERDELGLLRRCLPLMGRTAKPVHTVSSVVQAWNLPFESAFGEWNVIAVANLTDMYEDVQFSMNDLGMSPSRTYVAHEFWDRDFYGIHQRSFSVAGIPPRSAKMYVLREEQKFPIFLATDLHPSQGSEELVTVGWDSKSESLMGVCRGPAQGRGTIFLYVPPGFLPVGASCVGAQYSYRWTAPVLEFQVTLGDAPAPFSLRFARTEG
ncbi:hypothetical protein HN937_27970, partial [Candidatus Poribacteria bacterium]|nr:hypothetical protein [Candidatus Poribacteria bacterium]